jgi:hypothetical protein
MKQRSRDLLFGFVVGLLVLAAVGLVFSLIVFWFRH